MSEQVDERRRTVLKATAAAATAGAVGVGLPSVGAQEGTLGEFLSNVSNFESVTDRTGEDAMTVSVGAEGNNGAFAFAPPAVRVDPGTTVTWEWTGNGGQHDVSDVAGNFGSETTGESGFTFEQAFEETGVVRYVCAPHETMGMRGAVIVGDVEVYVSAAKGDGGGTADGESADGGGEGDAGPSYLDEEPDYEGWFDDVGTYEGTVDRTGEEEVTIAVGAEGDDGPYAFDPPAVAVDPGTTVAWEWTGADDVAHDVAAETGEWASETIDTAGARYGLTFDGEGISKYVCSDHTDRGMKGAVVVGGIGDDGDDEGTLKTVLLGLAGAIVAVPAVASRLRNRGD
jgi:halocyanin-like protein